MIRYTKLKSVYLEPVEVCVESVSTLNVGHQAHGQLFVILVSDVHHSGDVQRQTIHSCKSETETCRANNP